MFSLFCHLWPLTSAWLRNVVVLTASPRPRPSALQSSLLPGTDDNVQIKLFIFGLGYVGEKLAATLAPNPQVVIAGTCRDPVKAQRLREDLNISAFVFDGNTRLDHKQQQVRDTVDVPRLL